MKAITLAQHVLHWSIWNLYTAYTQACPLDEYTLTIEPNSPNQNRTFVCVQCTVCEPGSGVKIDCLEYSDTVCRSCGAGEYSEKEWDKRVCSKCTRCSALNRKMEKPCSSLNNTVCGDCLQGYVSEDSEECVLPEEEKQEEEDNLEIPPATAFDSSLHCDSNPMLAIEEHLNKHHVLLTRDELAQIKMVNYVSLSLAVIILTSVVGRCIYLRKTNRLNCSSKASNTDEEPLMCCLIETGQEKSPDLLNRPHQETSRPCPNGGLRV